VSEACPRRGNAGDEIGFHEKALAIFAFDDAPQFPGAEVTPGAEVLDVLHGQMISAARERAGMPLLVRQISCPVRRERARESSRARWRSRPLTRIRASGEAPKPLSKSGAKAVSAALRPAEAGPHRAVVTAVRPTAAPALAAPAARDLIVRRPLLLESPFHPDETPRANAVQEPTPTLPASLPRTLAEPLTADLRRLHVTVSRRVMEKLAAARAALSHSHPGSSEDEILEAGLDLILERHAKRKGLVEKPRREPPPSKPDHVPAHVKRAVWKRDGGRCQWPVDGGGVCGSTHQVELDHVVPRGRGGPTTIENTRCLCRIHNRLAARQVYGDALMDRFTVRRAKRRVLSGMKGARLRMNRAFE